MFQKIVIAFDGTEGSLEALDYATKLGNPQETELTVVHVVKDTKVGSPNQGGGVYGSGGTVTPYNPAELETPKVRGFESEPAIINESNDPVIAQARSRLRENNLSANFIVLEGKQAKKICEYAEQQNADVIVIGSRGVSGYKKFMIGSVSEKVAKEADVPVFIVK